VRVQGQEEQPRVLLLSVPYALKAADAQTLGGLPASAFVQAFPGGAAGKAGATSVPGSLRAATSALPPATSNVTTTGGTAQHLAMFTKATNIQNSIVLQMGTTAIDVVGNLGINNTTPSQSLDVKSGNAIVTGAGNFLKAGNTANSLLG
jgi:trimeric autotransporter adhesin